MKIPVSLCLAACLGLAVPGYAQLVAGSPEDQLFRQITSASTPAEKITLAHQFEEEFPDSSSTVLASVYTVLMTQYELQQEAREAVTYGEKVIAEDPDNVNAYMTLCRLLSVNLKEDLPKAVEYGERAVTLAEALKAQDPPVNYTPEQWESYATSTEEYARGILTYAKAVQP